MGRTGAPRSFAICIARKVVHTSAIELSGRGKHLIYLVF